MKPAKICPRRNERHAGFTLVEILIAMTIMGVLTIGIISVIFQATKAYYENTAVLGVNRDIRSFTSKMDTDAVQANFFRVYSDFATRQDASGNELAMEDGQIGDMVVFVYVDPAMTSQGVSMIQEMVGYYREVTDLTRNTGPVHRFDVLVSPNVDATTTTVAALLASKLTGSISTYPVMTQLAQGLALNATTTTPTPKLFYNFANRSVMIDAQITESLNDVQKSTSRLGNTYNFTVSPRG